MPPAARRRVSPEDRQDELLDATVRVFERHEFQDVNVTAIAKEAGISMGLLYHYYPDCQALFVAAFERLARNVVRACLAGANGDGFRFVRSSLEAYFDYATRHPATVRVILRPARVAAGLEGMNDQLNEQMATLLTRVLSLDSGDVNAAVGLRAWLAYVDASILAMLSGTALERERFTATALRVLRAAASS